MNKEILTEQEKLFMYLLGTFQSSAWISLGKTENPMTGEKNTNKEQAALNNNHLEMLQEKTKGNLTDYEEQMLINTVSELKLNLIDEKKNSNGKEKIRKTK